MKIRIQIAMEGNNGEFERIENIVDLERSLLQPETLGLHSLSQKRYCKAYKSVWLASKLRNTWHNSTPALIVAHVEQRKGSILLCIALYLVS